jgi:O-antigen/teichoic acid export membrane protein
VGRAGPPGAVQEEPDLRIVARGGLLSLIGVVAGGVLQFVFVVLISRLLDAEGAGIFFEAIALFMIATNIAEFGADTGLVRSIPSHRVAGSAEALRGVLAVAIWPVVAAATVMGLAMYVFAPQLADALIRGGSAAREGAVYIRWLAPFLPVSAASAVVLAGTRGFGTMVPFVAVENVGKPALRPLLFGAVAAAGMGAAAIAFSWGVPIVVGLVAGGVALRRLLRRAEAANASRNPAPRPGRLFADFWRFAGPRGVAATFQTASSWIGIILVGALAAPREAGIFAAVNRVAVMGTFALNAVNLAVGPQISHLLSLRRADRAGGVFQVAAAWLMGISWPLYLTLAVFAPVLLRVFGQEFVAGQDALVILSLGMLVNMGTGNCHIVLLMAGKSSWNLVNTVVSIAVNVTLALLLIPRYGATGAAIAWAAAIVIDNVATVVEVAALLGLSPFWRGYYVVAGGAVVAFAGVGVAVRALLGPNVPAFAVFAVASVALYGAWLWRHRDELQLRVLGEAIRSRTRRSRTDEGLPVAGSP